MPDPLYISRASATVDSIPMSDNVAPEVKFANELKAVAQPSPAITAFVDTLTEPGLSQMDRLSRVARIAYQFGGLSDHRSAGLMKVWMGNDPVACHGFFRGEDRLRVDKRVRALEKENKEKTEQVAKLTDKVIRLEADQYDLSQLKLQEERGAANGNGGSQFVKPEAGKDDDDETQSLGLGKRSSDEAELGSGGQKQART